MSQKILNSSDFFAKIQIFCYHFFIYKKLVKILLKIFYGKSEISKISKSLQDALK